MFRIGKSLVSEEILENNFQCNISKSGRVLKVLLGLLLEINEVKSIEKDFNKISKYLCQNCQNSKIKRKVYYYKRWKIRNTTCGFQSCVYVHYEPNGTLSCAIEKAYNKKEIDFNKPISCHLYPIRVKEYSEFTAVNYHKWSICSDACSLVTSSKNLFMNLLKMH